MLTALGRAEQNLEGDGLERFPPFGDVAHLTTRDRVIPVWWKLIRSFE